MPVVLATRKDEAGGSLEARIWYYVLAMYNRARPPTQKTNKQTKYNFAKILMTEIYEIPSAYHSGMVIKLNIEMKFNNYL